MGNRVYLYNASDALPAAYLTMDSPDQAAPLFRDRLSRVKFGEAGETNNTGVPIPWMLYFGKEDFMPILCDPGSDENDDDLVYQLYPCTTVAKAKERILATLPVFERLAGDPSIGREYWQEAIDLLDKLPLPYLTMYHTEWVQYDEDDDAAPFEQAYDNGPPSDDVLMEHSCYTEGVTPYSHEEWDMRVTHFDPDNERQMNAIAMGHGHSLIEALHGQDGIGHCVPQHWIHVRELTPGR